MLRVTFSGQQKGQSNRIDCPSLIGGDGEIRTHEPVSRLTPFQGVDLNHSSTSPHFFFVFPFEKLLLWINHLTAAARALSGALTFEVKVSSSSLVP